MLLVLLNYYVVVVVIFVCFSLVQKTEKVALVVMKFIIAVSNTTKIMNNVNNNVVFDMYNR